MGHNAFRLNDISSISIPRLAAAGVAAALILAAVRVPALAALAALAVLFVGLAAFETAYSPLRAGIREGKGR